MSDGYFIAVVTTSMFRPETDMEKVANRKITPGSPDAVSLKDAAVDEAVLEELNSLKREHLREGVPAIMTAIIDEAENEEEYGASMRAIRAIREHGDFVDFDGAPDELTRKNMRNRGKSSYVISECNGHDKWSNRYCDCTGIVLVGMGKDGKEVSFLSHQNPDFFIGDSEDGTSKVLAESFERDLKETIRNLLDGTEEETRDAIILGGKQCYRASYMHSVRLLGEFCKDELGFYPVVITGPNTADKTSVYFDTQNRRMYLVRPKQNNIANNNSYMPSQLDDQPW